MNTANFDLVLEKITSCPEQFDQKQWHCGTQHCLFGWAQILAGKEPNDYTVRRDARIFFDVDNYLADWLSSPARTLREFEAFRDSGYDCSGFNRDGFNSDGFNSAGYDRAGFNSDGYDRTGFNRTGFNRAGFNRDGFNSAGYDLAGFNRTGFDRAGYDSDGLDSHNKPERGNGGNDNERTTV